MPPVRIAHQAVHTPWDQKGMLMRTLVERSQGRELVLVDGVKVIEDDGWALVLPDPEEPLTHVWAEAPSAAQAEARARSTPPGSSSCCTDGSRPRRPVARAVRAGAPGPRQVGSGAMNVPDDLRYSSDHEWARATGDRHPGGHHRLRPGRARRRGVRRPARPRVRRRDRAACSARSSRPSPSRRSTRPWPARSWPSTPRSPTPPSSSTPTRTARAGSARSSRADPSAVDALLDAAGYRQLTEG